MAFGLLEQQQSPRVTNVPGEIIRELSACIQQQGLAKVPWSLTPAPGWRPDFGPLASFERSEIAGPPPNVFSMRGRTRPAGRVPPFGLACLVLCFAGSPRQTASRAFIGGRILRNRRSDRDLFSVASSDENRVRRARFPAGWSRRFPRCGHDRKKRSTKSHCGQCGVVAMVLCLIAAPMFWAVMLYGMGEPNSGRRGLSPPVVREVS